MLSPLDSDAICAFPRAPVRTTYAPRACALGVDGNANVTCEASRTAVSACPLFVGFSSNYSASSNGAYCGACLRKNLAAGLARTTVAAEGDQVKPAAGSLAIVGDSMARQAFVTLVARLRGLDWALDFNVHGPVHYSLFGDRHGLQFADSLKFFGVDPAILHGTALDQWAASHASHRHHNHHSSHARLLDVDFLWGPCLYNFHDLSARAATQQGRQYSHIVLFPPAYWHLSGSCGHKPRDMLNATQDSVMGVFEPWLAAAARGGGALAGTAFTVVTPPIEHLRPGWREQQVRWNRVVSERFAARAFPSSWRLFDWAALMAERKPPSIVPSGDQKFASWHYVCQFYRKADWYVGAKRNHSLHVLSHPSGDCTEFGNTLLWEGLWPGSEA